MSKHQPYPPTPFYDRLTELSKLKAGWLDGRGNALSADALKSASVLGAALPMDVSLRIYPTETGGVSLEWDDQHGGHEIVVLPDGHLSLMTVDRIEQNEMRALRAEVAAARKFAAEMRDFCSPHAIAMDYADRLIEAMDRAKASQADQPAPITRVSDEVIDDILRNTDLGGEGNR